MTALEATTDRLGAALARYTTALLALSAAQVAAAVAAIERAATDLEQAGDIDAGLAWPSLRPVPDGDLLTVDDLPIPCFVKIADDWPRYEGRDGFGRMVLYPEGHAAPSFYEPGTGETFAWSDLF